MVPRPEKHSNLPAWSARSLGVKLDEEIFDVHALDAIRVAPEVARALEAGPEGLEFIAFGPHHDADGEPVKDSWVQ